MKYAGLDIQIFMKIFQLHENLNFDCFLHQLFANLAFSNEKSLKSFPRDDLEPLFDLNMQFK